MMHRSMITVVSLALALVFTASEPARAQRQTTDLALPAASPEASVGQTVGVTKISITYHRPAVNNRKIWGGLVPYGEVWRTGADENTLISFSTDVQVNGKTLAAGTYGLHTIPGETEWQIIFSHDTTAWGSYSYDQARDALRVTARPEPAAPQERLLFSFEEVSADSAIVSLRWEKVRVPLTIKVDTKNLALESIRAQLKGLAQFSWQGWDQAAQWALQNQIAYEEALKWADQSIQLEERFDNLATQSQLLEKVGKKEEAAKLMERAMAKGNAFQIHGFARQLLSQGRKQEAFNTFKKNAELHPNSWVIHVGLGRGYSALGDFDKAVVEMQRAYEMAPDGPQKVNAQSLLERLKKKEDVN